MKITGKARLAAVIGWPVSHSLSPVLHNAWIERCRLDAAYVPLPVRPDNLPAVLEALPNMGFAGANLTLPHKEIAFRTLSTRDEAANAIGAVNTLVIGEDGQIEGRNTDAFGFSEAMRAAGRPLAAFQTAAVLGAGGAARAILYALIAAGVPTIRLLNRTRARADALAQDMRKRAPGRIDVLDWADWKSAGAGCSVLINTTSLGLDGQPALDLDLNPFPTATVVSDIVYRPLMTPLLIQAQSRGHPIVTGLGMLIHQARAGFQAWFGVDPPLGPEIETLLIGHMERQP